MTLKKRLSAPTAARIITRNVSLYLKRNSQILEELLRHETHVLSRLKKSPVFQQRKTKELSCHETAETVHNLLTKSSRKLQFYVVPSSDFIKNAQDGVFIFRIIDHNFFPKKGYVRVKCFHDFCIEKTTMKTGKPMYFIYQSYQRRYPLLDESYRSSRHNYWLRHSHNPSSQYPKNKAWLSNPQLAKTFRRFTYFGKKLKIPVSTEAQVCEFLSQLRQAFDIVKTPVDLDHKAQRKQETKKADQILETTIGVPMFKAYNRFKRTTKDNSLTAMPYNAQAHMGATSPCLLTYAFTQTHKQY